MCGPGFPLIVLCETESTGLSASPPAIHSSWTDSCKTINSRMHLVPSQRAGQRCSSCTPAHTSWDRRLGYTGRSVETGLGSDTSNWELMSSCWKMMEKKWGRARFCAARWKDYVDMHGQEVVLEELRTSQCQNDVISIILQGVGADKFSESP